MTPINFKQVNRILNPAEGTQDVVRALPVYNNGLQSISCWQFTEEEWAVMSQKRCFYIGVFSGESAPPILPYAEFPPTEGNFQDCVCYFKSNNPDILGLHILNTSDTGVPSVITYNGQIYFFAPQVLLPTKVQQYNITDGTLYLRRGNDYELFRRKEKTISDFEALKITQPNVIRDFYAALKANHEFIPVLVERMADGKDKLHI